MIKASCNRTYYVEKRKPFYDLQASITPTESQQMSARHSAQIYSQRL